jgi:ABC-type protease/lipase transport system fused ATPase/permease subunit
MVLQCVDKILVMKAGQAAAFGPKDQVLASLMAPAKAPAAAIASGGSAA